MNPQQTLFVTGGGMRRLDEVFRPPTITSTPLPAALEPLPGYSFIREIAPTTFLARPKEGEGLVVVRILPMREVDCVADVECYAKNVENAAQLRMPDIASVLCQGSTADGRMYLVREYVAGVPLDVFARGEALGQAGPIPIVNLVKLFARICQAVGAIHAAGVVHGNLKPTNILIDSAGHPHITDSGVSHCPKAGPPADLAALGTLFFELLWRWPAAPDSNLAEIASRATSRQAHGFASVEAFGAALEQYLVGDAPRQNLTDATTGLRQWIREQVARPWQPMIIGSGVGLVVGTFSAIPATQAMLLGSTGSVWETSSLIVRHGSWLIKLWLLVAVLLSLGMGAISTIRAQAKSRVGNILAGTLTGITAGIVAWLMGAGGFIGTAINVGPARTARALVAEFPTRPAFAVTSSFDVTANHPQEQLLDVHPELTDVAEPSRSEAIHARLMNDLKSSAFAAGWLGPIIPLSLAWAFGAIGASAFAASTQGRRSRLSRSWMYMELSLPRQFGLACLAASIIRMASGTLPLGSLVVSPAILVLAVAIILAVQTGVPVAVRIGCYVAGFAFLFRMAGRPAALWIELPIYVAALASLVRLVATISRPREVDE